jgi:hypothetical protein
MQIRKGKPPGSGRLTRTGVELSWEARVRLAWMDFYCRCRNVAHTCRRFGINRQTYRWRRRYDPYDFIRWRSAVIVPGRAATRLGLFP